MTEEKQDLGWGVFWARILGGLALGAGGAIGGQLIIQADTVTKGAGVAVIALLIAIFAFMLSRYRRADEFDRAIDRVTSVQAGIATIGLIMVQNMIAALGLLETEPLAVYAMPGFFILYKTLTAQVMRAAIIDGKDIAATRSLRA